ncbi:hemerythrin domain-containing protein [Mycobacterium sp. 1164966.3]|uniref:hemerythrin domain-containing protein n=1 Tax=Mycobacterium sp. 1164966.3 TaxID=1856861 RepID=UPI0012E7DA8C|nr:hemerythrin domain-containing protein [Mycobacterium sp. 1164966.3]
MPTDAFEMAMVHRVFRSELRSASELIRQVHPGQYGRRKRVADHILNVLAALHHHHHAEDELLWPTLRSRVRLRADDIDRMETEHALMAKLVSSVEVRLAAWIADTDCTAAGCAPQSSAAQKLIYEIETLAELVNEHFNAEELRVVPLINECITDAEWHATTERGASFLTVHNIGFGVAFIGMVLETCTVDERRRFLAGMSAPRRVLAKLFAGRVASSYRARLESQPS